MQKLYEDEVKLKQDLDQLGIRYGDSIKNDYVFIIYFYDNKGLTIITRGLYKSPITAIRELPKLLEQIKLPVDDIDIKLIGIFDEEKQNYINCPCNLSYKMYFKEKEVEIKEKSNQE